MTTGSYPHYSKFALNTWQGTPYFQAFVPPAYPLHLVLQKARAFRRLPPNLRALAVNSRKWAEAHWGPDPDIARWYDAQRYELDPETGRRLTDVEIDSWWDAHPDPAVAAFQTRDIPVPAGGFPDPDTWEPPPTIEVPVDRPTPEQILNDVATAGIARTEQEYGINLGAHLPEPDPPGSTYNQVKARFDARLAKVLASPYFVGREQDKKVLEFNLPSVDTYHDLSIGKRVFDRVEEYEAVRAAQSDH